MALMVIGDGPAAAATAGFAAAMSREPILMAQAHDGPPYALHEVELAGSRLPLVVAWATSDVEADAFALVADVALHADLLRANARRLSGKPLLLAPGGVGGALATVRLFETWGIDAPLAVEATGFPAIGRLRDATVVISAIKRTVPAWSAATGSHTDVARTLGRYFPNVAMADLATTTVGNTNAIIHPAVTLANAERIQGGERFRFYREGLTPTAVRSIDDVDADRREIARSLGAEPHPVTWWMRSFYADQGLAGASIEEQLRSFEPFADSQAPATLLDRYILDDVGFGLAPLEAIADRLGLGVPAIRALVDRACQLTQRDLRMHAARLADLVLGELRSPSPATPATPAVGEATN